MSICAVATISNKETNQDDCKKSSYGVDFAAIVVSDGIGSSSHAELASGAVCEAFENALFAMQGNDLDWLFDSFGESIKNKLGELDPIPEDANGLMETTGIVALETEKTYELGYMGNGAIYHLRGNFSEYRLPNVFWPWVSLNYLNPHSDMVNGKDELYRYLSPRSVELEWEPTKLSLSKDLDRYGEIIVICSDGIDSTDHTNLATQIADGNMELWLECSKSISLLFEALSQFFDKKVWTDNNLEQTLNAYLQDLQEQGLVDDDCTVGVIISDQAITYQKNRKDKGDS